MAPLGQFVEAVFTHWIGLLSGCLGTVALGVYEKFFAKKPIPKPIYAALLAGFLFFACVACR